MFRIKNFHRFLLSLFSIFALIGLCLLYAQVHTQGKPPKDSDLVCNGNDICEWEEAKSSTSEECEDCQPKTYLPLSMSETDKEVATTGAADFSFSKGKVFQFKIDEMGQFRDTWASYYLDAWTRTVSIGDADNDGQKEIITVLEFESGRGKKTKRYQKIFLFEDGSDGSPSWQSPEIGLGSIGARDSIIADADNDGLREIVIVNDMHVEIYRITLDAQGLYIFENDLPKSQDYENIIWSVDVGDVNSDGANEIVLAMSDLGAAIITHFENRTWGSDVITDSIGVCNINYAKVMDADNDGYNEIVGGGSPRILDEELCGDLTIWKYDGIGSYFNVFQDAPLCEEFIQEAVFIQGVDVGDVDGDSQNEVVIGTASADSELNRIYIYKYNGNSYVKQEAYLNCSGVSQLSVGDIDNDPLDEIVAASHGITIFEYVYDELMETFNCAYGGYLEID